MGGGEGGGGRFSPSGWSGLKMRKDFQYTSPYTLSNFTHTIATFLRNLFSKQFFVQAHFLLLIDAPQAIMVSVTALIEGVHHLCDRAVFSLVFLSSFIPDQQMSPIS